VRRPPLLILLSCVVAASACTNHQAAAPTTSSGPVAPTTTAVPSPTTATPKGPLAVGVRTLTFVDASRPTPATSAGPARPSRTLVTTVWYPMASGRFPLVVWAHGYNRVSTEYQSLLRRWASAGYVVAGPNLPSLRRPAPGQGPASEADARSEPGDLSFVIGALATSPLGDVVDTSHVIAAGHSDGAIDALAVALAQCCHDPRIGAVVSIAGAEEAGTFGAYTAAGPVPLLVVQGDHDVHLTVGDAHAIYNPAAAPKFLLILRGADHNTSLLDVGAQPATLLADEVVAFSDRYAKNLPTVAGMDRDAASAGFADLMHQP